MESNKYATFRAVLVSVLLALSLPVLAQTEYGLVRRLGMMFAEPSLFASSIGSVPQGEKVEFLQRDGIWWKVRWQGKEGWMNRVSIEKIEASAAAPTTPIGPPAPVAAPPAAPAVLATPAPAPPVVASAPAAAPVTLAPVMTPAIVPGAAPALSAAPRPSKGRAVIFGISNYQPGKGITSLEGVPRDMDSAVIMAQLMGVTTDRISIYRDADVTKASMTSVLTQLAKEVSEGDPVLLYFSGHGSRSASPQTPGGCIEGLVTHDVSLISNTEMAQLIQPLAKITDGLFVFFDACHSGGLSVTRATGNQRFTPKFVARADGSNCSEIVNMLQSPPPGTRATGNRYIYAAAARANEISLDDPQTGGLATANFMRCMVQGGSGTQTVDAIRACAQAGINKDVTSAGDARFKPHNLTITGDLNTRPVRVDFSPAVKQQLLASAAQGTLSNRPAGAKAAYISSALINQGWPAVFNPQQAFDSIAARADATAVLQVDAPQTLKIDSQMLSMNVKAPADGFFYVFQATGDGKNAVMLFPNTIDRDHRVRAGQSLQLPRPGWPLVAGGPEGENQLLVVFSKTERDISQLVGQEAGPFLDLAVSPIGMQALTLAISRSAYADEADCKTSAASRPAYCAAAYSASVKTIREIR